MTILGKRNYKRAGAVTIGFAGLLLASIAVAYPGDNDKDGWNDDGDKDGWNDDDDRGKGDKDGWHDDDDDGKGGKGKGKNDREPRFEDEGDSLKAELELRNLKKNQRVRAELEASAEVEIECRSNKGGKGKGKGKGKDKDFEKELDIELEGVEFFNKNSIKGNRLEIEVETEEAEDALDDKYGHDGGCPKGYDRRIKKVSFLDAKLEVEQGKKEVVTWLCTFDDPTRDGRVRDRDVDCHRL